MWRRNWGRLFRGTTCGGWAQKRHTKVVVSLKKYGYKEEHLRRKVLARIEAMGLKEEEEKEEPKNQTAEYFGLNADSIFFG